MDLLFVNPLDSFSRGFGVTPPLGLMGMAAYCRQQGFSVAVLDLNIEPETFDFSAYLRTHTPSIVGISGTTHSRMETFRLAAAAKSVLPGVRVVYGGCHATFTSEDTLQGVPEIDFVVRGEGELTMAELAHALLRGASAPADVRGISYRRGSEIVQTPARERLLDLDVIPHGRDLVDLPRYGTMLHSFGVPATTIMTSRGCPFNCFFCSASAMFHGAYSMRSAKSVADEIAYCQEKYGLQGIRFFDSALTLQRTHIGSLLDEFKRRSMGFIWGCEIRADTVDKELLTRMRDAGCRIVDFGVESASDSVRKRMGKRLSLEQAVSVLHWCRDLGITTVVFFSFGHPGERWRDARETLRFIDRNYHLISGVASAIFGINIYPGTPLEGYARSHGFLPVGFRWSAPYSPQNYGPIRATDVPILLQPDFGVEELQRCYYEYETLSSRKFFSFVNLREKARAVRSPGELWHKAGTALRLAGLIAGRSALFSWLRKSRGKVRR